MVTDPLAGPPSTRAGATTPRLAAFVLAAVTLAHAQKFLNGWALDDRRLIFSERVQHLSNAVELFRHNALWITGTDGGAIDTYRPLSILTFLVDHAIGGATPWIHHTTNLALHLAATALVLTLALRLTRHAAASALVAAFFGLNAGTAEAHVWINGRSDALMTTLGLAFVLGWLHWRARRRSAPLDTLYGALLMLLATIACMAKEVFVLALPALPLLERADREGRDDSARRSAWVSLLPAFGGAALYLLCRRAALGGMAAGGPSTDWLAVARTLPVVWWDGVQTILLPTRQAMRMLAADYATLPGWVPTLAALGAVAVIASLPWAIRRAPALAAAMVVHGATLAPIALLAHSTWPGMARYTYLASAFWAIGAAPLLARAWPRTPIAPWLVGGLIAIHVLLLQAHIAVYRDETTFAEAMLQENPRAIHGHLMLAQSAMERGDAERAHVHFSAAVATGWPHCKAWDGLLVSSVLAGHVDRGRERVPDALGACPDDARILNAAGLLSEGSELLDEACIYWARCLCVGQTHERTFCRRNLDRVGAPCADVLLASESTCPPLPAGPPDRGP